MRMGRILPYAAAMALAASVIAVTADSAIARPADKKFTFSTKSKEAKEHVMQAVRAIDSYQFGPAVQDHLKKAIEADPNFAFAHYLMWATTFPPPAGQPHIEKAKELAKTATEAERNYIEAMTLLRAQKRDEAIKILETLRAQYPDERLVRMMLGQAYTITGKFPEAKASFEKAADLDGSTARVYGFLGNLEVLQGNYGKARDLYKKAITKKAPGTTPNGPYYGMAFTYVYEGDTKTALDILTNYRVEYVKSGGDENFPSVFLWNSIARLQLENGHPEEALKSYEQGFEVVKASKQPEQEKLVWLGRLHHGRGRALSKLGKHDEAWKEAETIKAMIEKGGEEGKQYWPAYHYMAGYLKLEGKDYAAAIEHLKQADQENTFHLLLLARAYEGAGDKANAQATYQKIVASPFNDLERALSYPEAKRKLKA